jgi:hypothetical protein
LLAEHGRLDYLTLEYLAELTMSILAIQRRRRPDAGFASDFLDVLSRLGPTLQSQPRLKIVTNAGGMNPVGCAAKAAATLKEAGVHDRVIASVAGDDLFPALDSLLADGHSLTNLDTGEPLSTIRANVVSANAYLGAPPIVESLRGGASIIITGRVADASLTLAPAVFELGWAWDDWHRLAAGTVAGHLIECGAQVTGGLWCNWPDAPDMANVGYPIAEIEESGTVRVTKPPGTGGRVNRETVCEQLLYEVGNPGKYITPDVVADFTSPMLRETGSDEVTIDGCSGTSKTDTYKVSIAYRDGFMANGTLTIAGPDAVNKARRTGEIILQRLDRAGMKPENSNIECLGAGDCLPGLSTHRLDAPEVVLRVAVRDSRREVVERFSKEMAPPVCSGLPGTTGYTSGRPPVREVFAYWPALIAKDAVKPRVEFHSVR